MTTQELANNCQKVIKYLTLLIKSKSMSYTNDYCIKNIIKQYKIIKERAESGKTNLMEYSIGYNYSAYLKCNLPCDVKSLKQYSEKYTLDDIEEMEDISFYIKDKYITINPNEL
jgi:hypothetical protein